MASNFYRWDKDDLLLNIRVQPRASRNKIVGIHADALKVQVTSPPADGKANQCAVKLIAHAFGVSKSAVAIVSGQTSRHKKLRITAPQKLPTEILRN